MTSDVIHHSTISSCPLAVARPPSRLLIFLCLLFAPMPANAVDIGSMLISIQDQIPQFNALLTGLCYVAGFWLVFTALMQLRKYGEARTMMSSNAELKGPLIQIVVGAMLVELPLILSISMETTFGTDSPIAYPDTGTSWDDLASTIILIVQFVGGVAMARGLFLFNKLGSGQAQPGTFGKAVIHVIGGTLCWNVYGTTQILFTTLGIFN